LKADGKLGALVFLLLGVALTLLIAQTGILHAQTREISVLENLRGIKIWKLATSSMIVYTYVEMGEPSRFVYPEDQSIIGSNDLNAVAVTPKYMALWVAENKSFIKGTEIRLVKVAVFLVDVDFADPSETFERVWSAYDQIKKGIGKLGESSTPHRTFVGDDGYEYLEWRIPLTGMAFYPEGLHYLTLVNFYEDDPEPYIASQIVVRLDYDYVPPEQPEQPETQPSLPFAIPNMYDFLAGFGIATIPGYFLMQRKTSKRR
jgi:hypothetical protein